MAAIVRTTVATAARTFLAGLDGVLVGLTVGYVALTALGAPSQHSGLPWPIAIVVVGGMVGGVALAGAGLATFAARVAAWPFRRTSATLRSRGRRRSAALAVWPARVLGALPAPWIGAFLPLLWIALSARTAGPIGLLVPPGMLATFVYALGVAAALGAMARALRATPGGRIGAAGAVLCVSTAVAVVGGLVAYAAWPGPTAGLVAYDPAFDPGQPVAGSPAPPDPGVAGPFAVHRLSYGSGTDGRRPAFGDGAVITTPTVDASAVLDPLGSGADEVRRIFWGFGTDALPLNGLVWLPQGEGPFPLVLMVHGNHAMGDFSEEGYGYLGEHLASRGFIAVSVDEDFLNGSWADDWAGEEQVVRAWLLLLHADLWRSWSADPASPFAGLVDPERIALIGHSRGGEAASVAAMLAGGEQPPRPGMLPWPSALHIDAVVSIAPSDGQFGGSVTLRGVDFLTIQGGFDSDARAWSGIRQYARTELDPGGFKAALWSYRANHGQFNTVWGRDDQGPYSGTHLALAPLLTPDEQQDVARTAIGAFLEASLLDRAAYRGFFRRPMVGREWLPDDIILVRSAEGADVPLTGSSPDQPADGLRIEVEGLTASGAMPVPLRALQPDQGARAVNARWSRGATPAVWGVAGLGSLAIDPSPDTSLVFALADGTGVGSEPPHALRIEIDVLDADGTVATLALETIGPLPPPLPVTLAKSDVLMATTTIDIGLRSPVERVLQSYAVPLAAFAAREPAFDPARLSAIRLRIDRAAPGALWIADVGLRPGALDRGRRSGLP